MDKVLLINKDKGYTSRDVVNIISKKLNEKKVGHFGTLDPLATGLLVIGIGRLTKLGNLLSDETKDYEVEVLLGTSTDTYDITGKTIKTSANFNKEKIKAELLKLKITYNQEVPPYSAVKINGKKLYEYARNNEKVDLPKKEVTIFDINSITFKTKDKRDYLSFNCSVSKGTYIRSLINDLSKKTNTPMCMSNLKRTRCGTFFLKDAYTLEEITNDNFKFLDITDCLDIDKKEIPSDLETKILNGAEIDMINSKMILFTKDNNYIALYGNYKNKMKPYLTFKK